MKPFSLKHALAGEPVITRDGRKVTYLTKLEQVPGYQVAGVIENTESIARWTENGYFLRECSNHVADLFMYVEKNSLWVNVYEGRFSGQLCTSTHGTLNEANQNKLLINGFDYLKTIEITNEP
jgi:hypothetical protein